MKWETAFRLLVATVSEMDNWPEVLAAWCNDARGRFSRTDALRMRFKNGLDLEIMPGGLGAFYIIFSEIFIDETYEPPQFSLGHSPTIVDLGANVGFFSCKIAKAIPGARIIAVEPVPDYVRLLRTNVTRSGLPNVTIVPVAVANASEVSLEYWRGRNGYLKVSAAPPGVEPSYLKVPALTLKGLFESQRVDVCHLLKIDIEGGEYDALMSCPPQILARVRRISMEWHRTTAHHRPSELVRFLSNNGFEILECSDLKFERTTGMVYARRPAADAEVELGKQELADHLDADVSAAVGELAREEKGR